MKNLFCLLFTLFSGIFLTAQTPKNVDGGAVEMLNDVSKKYAEFSTIQFDFTYKREKNTKTLETFKGKLFIKGKSYQTAHNDQQFYCDGVTIWNYQPVTNEVSIFEYDENEEQWLNPARMLANWSKLYRAKLIREEFVNNKILLVIALTPVKTQSYYKIQLKIELATNELKSIAIYEKDNTIYTYIVYKMVVNKPLDDSKFKFNASQYAGIQINDMR
ncbi:MAG: outer membrane lipoprotein carrier protein LolA [Bacteroidales bacterium]|jgi:outer membrane lipoprotein-sorting protein|nr:outer membrane lipoprotein carrier protein LolA [Bacteroidales bacterium]